MATLSPYEIINMEHQDHDKKYTHAQALLTCHVSDYNKCHAIPGIVHQASAFHVSHVDPPNDCHVISANSISIATG